MEVYVSRAGIVSSRTSVVKDFGPDPYKLKGPIWPKSKVGFLGLFINQKFIVL